jgi:conjugal transfer pilus assembly protein TraK
MKKTILSTFIIMSLSGSVFAQDSITDFIGVGSANPNQDEKAPINNVSNNQPTFSSGTQVNADEVLRQELTKNLGLELEKQNKQAEKAKQTQTQTQSVAKKPLVDFTIEKGPVIKIKPSENKIVNVAVGMMNKIETPFYKAAVKTSNNGDITVEGGVIFITPKTKEPIGLIIREKGLNESMISLTLIPEDVPPVMLTADIAMTEEQRTQWYDHVKSEKEAKALEERRNKEKELADSEPKPNSNSSNFEGIISGLLKNIALGGVPNGYQLRESDFAYNCNTNPEFPSYTAQIKQVIEGSKLNVNVGYVKNETSSNLSLNETNCYKPGVLAVSAYPKVDLAPGEVTEIYIVEKREELTTDTARKRLY